MYVETLAKLIPDRQQLTCASMLVRRLLHADPNFRPTVQQVLQDDFCGLLSSWQSQSDC